MNTHLGLFRVNPPFGINVATGIFQRIISNVLRKLNGGVAYLENILITGRDDEDHLHNLEKLLMRVKLSRLQAKKKKCSFLQDSVVYLGELGYRDVESLHLTEEKFHVVREAPSPSSSHTAIQKFCLHL